MLNIKEKILVFLSSVKRNTPKSNYELLHLSRIETVGIIHGTFMNWKTPSRPSLTKNSPDGPGTLVLFQGRTGSLDEKGTFGHLVYLLTRLL